MVKLCRRALWDREDLHSVGGLVMDGAMDIPRHRQDSLGPFVCIFAL